MAGLDYCSAGVFDVDEIASTIDIHGEGFKFKNFLERSSQWGELDPRPKVKYEASPDVKLNNFTQMLVDFSISKKISTAKKLNMRDLIHKYFGTIDEPTQHMFCIHSRIGAHNFYVEPTIQAAVRLTSRPHNHRCFPSIIVVTDTGETANHSSGQLIRANMLTVNRENRRISICNLQNEVPEGPSLLEERRKPINILVGSAEKVRKYIESVTVNGELEILKESVMRCIVIGIERFAKNAELEENCRWICGQFQIMPTNFLFMYKFLKSKCKVVTAQAKCAEMVRGEMFVEVEKQEVSELYNRIVYRLITSSDELADRLSAWDLSHGKNTNYDSTRKIMQPIAQKVFECRKIIDVVRRERNLDNQTKTRARRERILVITKDSKTALFVTMSLRLGMEQNNDYNVKKIIVTDPVEYVETCNYEFRWLNLGILVIDWRSIHSVNRGTVDTVIMFDAPERLYFETMLDVEMENLISQICVRLKLYILVDQHADLMLMGQFAKHLEKHNRKAPQWFAALYETYRKKWHDLREERRTKLQIYIPPILENAEQDINVKK